MHHRSTQPQQVGQKMPHNCVPLGELRTASFAYKLYLTVYFLIFRLCYLKHLQMCRRFLAQHFLNACSSEIAPVGNFFFVFLSIGRLAALMACCCHLLLFVQRLSWILFLYNTLISRYSTKEYHDSAPSFPATSMCASIWPMCFVCSIHALINLSVNNRV